MTLYPLIEVGWMPGPIPRPQHPSWPDIELKIQVCHLCYGQPLSEHHVNELRDYLVKVAPVLPDYFLKHHTGYRFGP